MIDAVKKREVALWLKDKLPFMEADLERLVLINSYTKHKQGGDELGALLVELFSRSGLYLTVVKSALYADHLVFSNSPCELDSDGWLVRKDTRPRREKGKNSILLVGHLDTVFPPNTFEGYKRDGDLARGPGVLDMKGGLIVVAYALAALSDTVGMGAVSDLHVVIVSDEEVGSPEGKEVLAKCAKHAKYALVFESGREKDLVITARKGVGLMTVRAYGVAAHAGNNHQDGRNALWAMAKFIDDVQGFTSYQAGISVNVGTLSGGQSQNTVPDFAQAEVDLRFVQKKDADELEARVREAARKATEKVHGTRIEIEGGVVRYPMETGAESKQLADLYGQAAMASGLSYGLAPLVGGGSDANTTSSLGIASIDALGPRGKGFHTRDEQMELLTMVPKAEALARFLLAIGA